MPTDNPTINVPQVVQYLEQLLAGTVTWANIPGNFQQQIVAQIPVLAENPTGSLNAQQMNQLRTQASSYITANGGTVANNLPPLPTPPPTTTAAVPTKADYMHYLIVNGLEGDAGALGLVNQALAGKWSVTRFTNQLYTSSEYKQEKGKSYSDMALRLGLNGTDINKLVQQAISGNWTAIEFQVALRSTPQYIQRYSIGYKNQLAQWGIKVNGNLNSLITQAVEKGYNSQEFLYYLRQTPEYKAEFPGIFDANGGLKMSEAQYISQKHQYADYANMAGINLGPGKTAYLFTHNVSPREALQRFQAIRKLDDNQGMFQAFNEQLKFEGKQPLDRQGQFKFIMGMGGPEYYQAWNNSVTRYSGEQAGVQFGHAQQSDLNLKQGVVKEITGKGLTQASEQKGFAQLAQQLQTTLPQSRIQKYGLTKQDLVQLEFGGPRQASVAQQVNSIMANEKAFQTNEGMGVNAQQAQGIGQRGQKNAF